jgi:hypothetical protein|tara:strand:- start:14 stop:592 length:579 start_codon:yes stop_codon:yes gene_type:complete
MLVIGNGESRKDIDISAFNETKVGCNAIVRDFFVNHLVCVDRRMVEEVLQLSSFDKIYTRQDWINSYTSNKNVTTVPKLLEDGAKRWDEPFQWGSGPYAVLLSAKLCKGPTVRLVGFDLHSATNTVNNLYKDTSNYDSADKNAVDPKYWVHQISKVFEWFPQLHFKIYQKEDWILPNSWQKGNVSLDNLDNL